MIDLNSVDEDGETVVFLSDVSGGTLKKGFMVEAIEPEDKLCAPARVSSIREDLGIAFLQVDWKSVRRDQGQGLRFGLNKNGWATATSAARTQRARLTTSRGASSSVSLRQTQNGAS
ncbi:hypothetical protein ACI3KS_05055 [Microbacterium sp. ZW T5_45]|uniref:hypothetical protein n=1 Tax=Microbacterium sp. ZW T5_45 TaxID=3378080 RepID=UPI0038549DAD